MPRGVLLLINTTDSISIVSNCDSCDHSSQQAVTRTNRSAANARNESVSPSWAADGLFFLYWKLGLSLPRCKDHHIRAMERGSIDVVGLESIEESICEIGFATLGTTLRIKLRKCARDNEK